MGKQLDPNELFFTGCTHYGHDNVLNFCDRPFDNIEQHDEQLLQNHNEKVPEDGIVYHLGDVFFGKKGIKYWRAFYRRLNGEHRFILGNHDRPSQMSDLKNGLSAVKFNAHDKIEIKVADDDGQHNQQFVFMSHYPHLFWNKSHYGSWHLFSHVHGGLNDDGSTAAMHGTEELMQPFDISKRLMIDVGVDVNDYTPLSYQDVKDQMKLKTWKPPAFLNR